MNHHDAHPKPTIFCIFGAGGDLTHRKLAPALYNLYLDGWMPEQFAILGMGRKEVADEAFRADLREGIDEFSRSGKSADAKWNKFASHAFFLTADLTDKTFYDRLKRWLETTEKSWGVPADRVFYLAVPPTLIETISLDLGAAGLLADREKTRLVAEKPFGNDLESAQKLNVALAKTMSESQIYRIDHYLGKETVQNILAFRFANSLFEPIWNRRYIDHVQITVAEEVGVAGRGGYYEGAGALRDMVQNHLLQILCHVAMEPPVTYGADEIRNKKIDVLRAVRPFKPEEVDKYVVRGQYGSGSVNGKPEVGYRQEPDVAKQSATETYAAMQIYVDNWRWQGVPFYLRTGKHLPMRLSEVCVQFRPVPHRSFPRSADSTMMPNLLTIRILPDEGILLRFQAKTPGHKLLLRPVFMRFAYGESFKTPSREAYETLLRDVMLGDQTLFMRADQVEAGWALVMPILEHWAATPPGDFPNYAAGSWGPEAADHLLGKEGRHWICTAEHADANCKPEKHR